jgi:uncharacterized protein (DUF1697 family)
MVSPLALLACVEGDAGPMTTYVALLYSIVIDQSRRVVMSDLRRLAEDLGHENVRTLVSSGNLVFDSRQTSIPKLETDLERCFAAFYGKHVDIIIKSAGDWRALVASNPFPKESAAEPDQVTIRIMRDPADAKLLDFFKPYQTQGERVAIIDGHVWVHFRGRPSLSKLDGQLTPKRMGGVGTARNWNTVRRLGEMVGM